MPDTFKAFTPKLTLKKWFKYITKVNTVMVKQCINNQLNLFTVREAAKKLTVFLFFSFPLLVAGPLKKLNNKYIKDMLELTLTLSGPRFFRYRKDRGTPSIRLKIGRWNTLYAHMLPFNFVGENFSFEGARPEKGLKI